MPITFTSIASTTLTTTAQSVSFTSIPNTYTDLVVVTSPAANAGIYDAYMGFNNSTAANTYTDMTYGSDGSSLYGAYSQNRFLITTDYAAIPTPTLGENFVRMHIFNYTSTAMFKNVLVNSNRGGTGDALDYVVGTWRSTSVVDTVNIYPDGTDNRQYWLTGSTFSLYGILKA